MKHIANDLFKLCKGREDVLMTEIIEVVLPHLSEDDFLLRKNFTIVQVITFIANYFQGVTSTYGKWPSIYGNAIFMDSNYILEDLAYMISGNLKDFFHKNNYGDRF